jgi:two-component system nitrogen regulation response regulator NtrX
MRPRILIIEDNSQWARLLARQLEDLYEPIIANTGEKGLRILKRDNPNCTILDLGLPDYKDEEDLPLLRILLNRYPETPVVILTGRDDTSLAVKAARLGAFDYISKKQMDSDKFLTTIRNAIEKNALQLSFKEKIESELADYPLLGESPAIIKLKKVIKKVAPSDEPVLITGETGTGKEVVARHLHYFSNRYAKRFIVATVPGRSGSMAYSELFGHVKGAFTGATNTRYGKFDLANNGTLFLDDVDLCSPDVQGMLLRVLEDHTFVPLGSNEEKVIDVRIIASTNKDLKQLFEKGDFREDLFYRLSAIKINVTPLRERIEDIGLLAKFFLNKELRESTYKSCQFSDEALSVMRDYKWPENIRGLKQTVKALYLLVDSDVINADDVAEYLEMPPETISMPGTFKEAVQAFQREFIERKLIENDKNISKTARDLGISRQHLQNLIKALDIEAH